MDSFWRTYGVVAVALVLILGSFVLGIYVGESRVPAAERVLGISNKGGDPLSLNIATADQVDFAPFWRVWNTLENKFVPRSTSTNDLIADQDKVWSAITGLVDAYDDPYTTFFKPAETETFKESARGSFEGVGMVVGIENEQLVVVAPLEDSPAMKAGVKAGDVIMKIDGVDSVSFSTDTAVESIRGEGGTEVVLSVKREGESDLIEIPIVRGKIDIPSTNTGTVSKEIKRPKENIDIPTTKEVTNEETGEVEVVPIPVEELPEEALEVVEQDFFFLRLFNFSESSVRAFKKGLEEFAESDTNKLIIDLRGNPGGFLQSAVDMASYFVPEGELIVREIVGAQLEERIHVSMGHDLLADRDDLQVVVLINRGSASASEILAGALQEYEIATLIGEKSFGKGSVQELVDITGDVSLKVTIARWFTPNGVSISENGLTPDVIVDISPPFLTQDPIFEAALEHLGSQ
jgi:carboxyl-terminal processing protease